MVIWISVIRIFIGRRRYAPRQGLSNFDIRISDFLYLHLSLALETWSNKQVKELQGTTGSPDSVWI
ncbi:MAG: hypothetical protein GTO45_08245 [Candidatus Aminicenantes bacterium]|nr:hypothetical protein [Candidatus Aminicenantes bacterium]NIM78822.1 hypothetical protein [Candidatus Aminicenantes bacterium]NIN18077.1 hypothetical protein [Candidatus Aminicenantes bacterium]NIN41976.1 hypothetical protein [Candidatus Aminicenantes bacterium]NIN84732.1 hypothetical protein [Candidatus Aminicenantes bacterium]